MNDTRDTTGNPAPLGLLGFGMTTVLLNFHNAGFYELNAMILAMGFIAVPLISELKRRAMERILANRKLEKFNSLEVVRVASKRFLGIHHVTVSAQSRHIQESPFLFRPNAKDFEVATPNGIELRKEQNLALSTGKELPLGVIKTPNLESVRI